MSKSFFHSVRYVFAGTFLAQLIPIAGTFLLARIFAPSDFGLYSVWLGFVLFLSVVLTGRFEMSLAAFLGFLVKNESRPLAINPSNLPRWK